MRLRGKISGLLPFDGELNPDIVRKAFGLSVSASATADIPALPGRPPQLCMGCPHIDTYNVINETLKDFKQSLVTSDIGCYALGAVPPYSAIETIVCMGASVGMAKGAAEGGLYPVLAVIGDSTFLHSGMSSLLDCVDANADMTLIIVDNLTVAMTGGQKTIVPSSRLSRVVEGLGVSPENIQIWDAHKRSHEKNVQSLKDAIAHRGLSVVISVRECIETARKK